MNFAHKKAIVFDLDGTLVASKLPITDEMAEVFVKVLDRCQVCVVSGEKFEQFQSQLITKLEATAAELSHLHIMPTCGTRYYRYESGAWKLVYENDLPEASRVRIAKAIEAGARELGLWEAKPWGEIIEDRGTMVAFSGLGQEAPLDAKLKWDPDGSKRGRLRNYLMQHLDGFEYDVAGTTSVDVTRAGIDKAFGVDKFKESLALKDDDIVFIGDQLQPGGNDHPVKAMGIDSIQVKDWHETERVINDLLSA